MGQKTQTDQQAIQCNDLVNQIEQRTLEVKQRTEDVEKKKKALWAEQERIVVDKQEAERELAEAAPALEAAAEALRSLERNKASIDEMRAYNTPPLPVKQVCECVAIVLGESDLSWENVRGMLKSADFFKNLIGYDTAVLLKKESIMSRVKPRLKDQDPETLKKKTSVAAGYLLEWVVALSGWYDKAKIVQPKKERVEAAEAKLKQSEQEIN
ncbi:putative dynein heavy chain 10, axonemal [Blattamonas nauphoetae]|uniref:Dynein heavy chain 10, axonemal n=1 Tax=Blattamonas nauphoetae TaxID=2049346 RepID=A0ABQ9XIU4_9EUKA|nr:putative dynein heavy chain 10, axonemal [Blattamonas nauphoetae]